MHEMSLCEGILQILEERAAADGFKEVRTVRLEIGRFAGVEIDALRFGFDVVMKGSVAENATLDVIDVPGMFMSPAGKFVWDNYADLEVIVGMYKRRMKEED